MAPLARTFIPSYSAATLSARQHPALPRPLVGSPFDSLAVVRRPFSTHPSRWCAVSVSLWPSLSSSLSASLLSVVRALERFRLGNPLSLVRFLLHVYARSYRQSTVDLNPPNFCRFFIFFLAPHIPVIVRENFLVKLYSIEKLLFFEISVSRCFFKRNRSRVPDKFEIFHRFRVLIL